MSRLSRVEITVAWVSTRIKSSHILEVIPENANREGLLKHDTTALRQRVC